MKRRRFSLCQISKKKRMRRGSRFNGRLIPIHPRSKTASLTGNPRMEMAVLKRKRRKMQTLD